MSRGGDFVEFIDVLVFGDGFWALRLVMVAVGGVNSHCPVSSVFFSVHDGPFYSPFLIAFRLCLSFRQAVGRSGGYG